MMRIAIFTEGQSELIFVRTLIPLIFGYEAAQIHCYKLIADKLCDAPYEYIPPNATFDFQIINVENDARVLSEINERASGLFRQGFEVIIGLRDMFSEEYIKRSKVIDNEIIQKFVQGTRNTIDGFPRPDHIFFFFQIMEFEAWLLSMYTIFPKINQILTDDYIQSQLGWRLSQVNPETTFFHPAVNLSMVLRLAGISYEKTEHGINGIVSCIDDEDLFNAMENERCQSFKLFFEKLEDIWRSAIVN
jgi:hypothetical protein